MADPRHTLGHDGERIAEKSLRAKGLRVLARRYVTPTGELDLVMRDRQTVVFVEVKTRHGNALADPQDAVNRGKQRRLLKAAEWFLHDRKLEDQPCRFDVVSIVIPGDDQDPVVEHFEDAFLPNQ